MLLRQTGVSEGCLLFTLVRCECCVLLLLLNCARPSQKEVGLVNLCFFFYLLYFLFARFRLWSCRISLQTHHIC